MYFTFVSVSSTWQSTELLVQGLLLIPRHRFRWNNSASFCAVVYKVPWYSSQSPFFLNLDFLLQIFRPRTPSPPSSLNKDNGELYTPLLLCVSLFPCGRVVNLCLLNFIFFFLSFKNIYIYHISGKENQVGKRGSGQKFWRKSRF